MKLEVEAKNMFDNLSEEEKKRAVEIYEKSKQFHKDLIAFIFKNWIDQIPIHSIVFVLLELVKSNSCVLFENYEDMEIDMIEKLKVSWKDLFQEIKKQIEEEEKK